MSTRFLLACVCLLSAPLFADEPQQFGAALPAGTPQPLAVAIDAYAGGAGPAALYSGRVAKVCQNKGCWMEFEDDGRSARVTMLDYGFFLPADASGRALVYGVLSEVELDEATAAHLAEDAGRPASEQPRREYRIVASGIRLLAP